MRLTAHKISIVRRSGRSTARKISIVRWSGRSTAHKIGIVRRSGRSTFILLSFQNRHDLSLNWLSGHFDIFFCDVNIDFGTDAELAFEVNSRLNGEGNAGNEMARI